MLSATRSHDPFGRRLRRRLGPLLVHLTLMAAVLVSPVLVSPVAGQGLLISTPYPSVSVQPGAAASFDLRVRADEPERVDLSVEDVPDGWTATLRGAGPEVSTVFADPDEPPELTLDVNVPEEAEAGTTTIAVVGRAGDETQRLLLDVTVVTADTGTVTLTTDVPARAGTADETFSFSLDLANDTPQEVTFDLQAVGPEGWTVSVEPSGEADATSVTVAARGSQTLNVEATPPAQASEGDYPLRVEALAGDQSAAIDLLARVTGRVEMTFTTVDERLNATATAGSATNLEILVLNSGTATLTGLSLAGTPPSEWEVAFDPAEIGEIAPGEQAAAIATITPSGNAVAGDYVVSLRASGEGVEESIDIRVTVETSPLWGALGLLLIVAALGGMVWVFRRYGRR